MLTGSLELPPGCDVLQGPWKHISKHPFGSGLVVTQREYKFLPPCEGLVSFFGVMMEGCLPSEMQAVGCCEDAPYRINAVCE